MKRLLPGALALLALAAQPARADDCQTGALGELVRQGKDLYLGEAHGSVEVPALMRCLIEVALDPSRTDTSGKLIVSLEQQPEARDLSHDAWRGTDGRSSEAMWELTQYLIREELAGRLRFHQQLRAIALGPGESPPPYDAVAYEKAMGEPLRTLAAQGQLIALSGNAHSRKKPFPGSTYQPAGAYSGADVVHVAILSAQGGTSWNCISNACGAHPVPGMGPMAGAAGSLTDGAWFDHDFIFWMPKVTASPPKLRNP